MSSTPMQFVATLAPEEAARANFYALLARLFYAAPDAALLQAIASEEDLIAEDDSLATAWRGLARAAAKADAAAVAEEYDGAFIGVGKSPVTLYTCAYSMQYTNEVPLVQLKANLASLGLARREGLSEPEDHIAGLCDVMRHLIAERAELAVQKDFFSAWIWPIVVPLCSAIEKSESTRFYKSVGAFLVSLSTVEHDAFEML